MTEKEIEDLEADAASAIDVSGGYADSIKRVIRPISKSLQNVSQGIRFYAMRPLFVLYCLMLLVAVAPVLILRLFH